MENIKTLQNEVFHIKFEELFMQIKCNQIQSAKKARSLGHGLRGTFFQLQSEEVFDRLEFCNHVSKIIFEVVHIKIYVCPNTNKTSVI